MCIRDRPTAYLCCQMGQWFLDHGKAQTAAGWYTLALHTPCREPETLSQHPGYDSWVPHLRLCRCYAALGNFTAAWEHNEKDVRCRRYDDSPEAFRRPVK